MNALDLFSGIGGFSLGLERAGFKTVAFCECDEFCRRVLRKHWPDVPVYDDVRTLTARQLAADGIAVDLIAGGFPCQDLSVAGKGAGIDGARSGLWSEFARIIGEVRPRYIIVENVSALLGRGLERVLGDLAALGFSSRWDCIPASAVGAPHRRDRIWIIAWRNDYGTGCQNIRRDSKLQSLWNGVCAAAGCGETRSWALLLNQMQQRGTLRADDGGYCSCQDHVLRTEYDVGRSCRPIRDELETCATGTSEGRRDYSQESTAAQSKSKISGNLQEDCHVTTGSSSSSSELQRVRRPTGKSCRCIEAQAFATAQAIGANLSQAIHGGSNLFRFPEWLCDYAAVVGVDVDGDASIPASAVGAPHRRDRIWIVAYAQRGELRHEPRWGSWSDGTNPPVAFNDGEAQLVADAHKRGQQSIGLSQYREQQSTSGCELDGCGASGWRAWADVAYASRQCINGTGITGTRWRLELANGGWWRTEPAVGELVDGLSGGLVRFEGRVAKGVPQRVEKLKALGNSLVPQIAEIIGRAILTTEASA